ncbi:MmcQ/YjbR family DNA-binding protein [Neptunomonas sp.]|uniref:MmcQ/YjbR family DNA-binding protein n=1 Tax=Neptunomonas sp. TaxID=1971898 RepID=UPI0025D5C52D|nr:MmcQ/YjbR family DNA-binding protein [Neptunomonas sp.]
MNTDQLRNYCQSFKGATEKDSKHPSNILSFSIAEKKFAYFKTSEPEIWRFSIRVTPERFLELTDQPGIKPARYMHRFHWVTIINVQAMDEEYLKQLVLYSYQKAMSSLPKKTQNQWIESK